MKQSTGETKAARRLDVHGEHDRTGIDELLAIVTRLRRAIDAGVRGRQARLNVRYADAPDEGKTASASAKPTTGVWGR